MRVAVATNIITSTIICKTTSDINNQTLQISKLKDVKVYSSNQHRN